MLLKATLWLTVTHTIKINTPNLTDRYKWICPTLWSCFSSLLTSKWDFSTGWLPYLLNILTQITKFFVISSYINDIETNLPIKKHTLHVFTWQFKDIVGKGLFWCFIYVFDSIFCFSLSLLTIYVVERNVVAYCQAYI